MTNQADEIIQSLQSVFETATSGFKKFYEESEKKNEGYASPDAAQRCVWGYSLRLFLLLMVLKCTLCGTSLHKLTKRGVYNDGVVDNLGWVFAG